MSSSWIAESTRFAIYHRDHFACVYCGVTRADGAQLTLDHVEPRSRGGDNKATNLVTCCTRCNVLRDDQSVAEWAEYLRENGVPADLVEDIPARVETQLATAIDRAEGRRLAAAARNPLWGFSKYIK